MTFAACVGSPPTVSMLVSPHRMTAASPPEHAKSCRAKPPLLPPRLVHSPHHAHATRPNRPRRRRVPSSAPRSPRQNPHSARGTATAHLRDFVPWRFSAAGCSSAWIGHHPGGRKPAQRQTSAGQRSSLRYTRDDGIENAQCIDRAVGFSLLKILVRLRHRVGNVGKTENFSVTGPGECIQSGGFHLDSEYTP